MGKFERFYRFANKSAFAILGIFMLLVLCILTNNISFDKDITFFHVMIIIGLLAAVYLFCKKLIKIKHAFWIPIIIFFVALLPRIYSGIGL